jgi:pSer/pThr/pTyr-binding forkhead associated (FHA) protein
MKLSFKTADGKKTEARIVGNQAVVGRSVKCDAMVTDESLSRRHCLVEIENGEFFITDLKSANGVSIDGNRIEPDRRTRFASFNTVTLGTVECQVEDAETAVSDKPSLIQAPTKIELESAERPTKRLNRDAINKPLKMKNKVPKKQSTQLNIGMAIAVMGFIFVVFYFYQQPPEVEVESIPTPEVKKTETAEKPKLQPIDTEMRIDAEYITNKSKGDCSAFQNYCDQLKLDSKFQETIFNDGLNYIIYLSPERYLEQDDYKILKTQARAQEFIAVLMMLNSILIDDYMMKNISSIHLVIMDSAGTPKRVLFFGPKDFNPDTVPRIEIIGALADALASKNTETFWTKVDPYIKSKEIIE